MVTFNTNSWHYKLASTYTSFSPYIHTDICSYTRKVVLSFFSLAMIALASVFIGWGIIDVALWAWFFYHGYFLGLMGPGIVTISLSIAVLIIAGDTLLSSLRHYKTQKEPGFIRKAYRSWKDKYCVKVEFK